jgi:hypothetical protein
MAAQFHAITRVLGLFDALVMTVALARSLTAAAMWFQVRDLQTADALQPCWGLLAALHP